MKESKMVQMIPCQPLIRKKQNQRLRSREEQKPVSAPPVLNTGATGNHVQQEEKAVKLIWHFGK